VLVPIHRVLHRVRSLAALLAVSLAFTLAAAASAQQAVLTPHQALGRELLRELVETNTTYSAGSTTKAADALAARFRAAGFAAADVQIVGPDSGRDAKDRNLIVRVRGRGLRRPVLLIGHLDVVEARREDWVLDPFVLTERDGHFYGRGTSDMKSADAALVAALLWMKQEGIVPAGDYVLALTAGEEHGGGYNGIQWLLAHRRDLLEADYVLNGEGGRGELRKGKPVGLFVQAAEKVSQTYRLTVRNSGGHSALPVKDNAIYRLAAALGRLASYDFPAQTNAITRAYFTRNAPLGDPTLAADLRAVGSSPLPDSAAAGRLARGSTLFNALLRTTCVATMIEGGHAINALPQRVAATVNCRILPGVDPLEVERTLQAVVRDTAVVVTRVDTATASAPSVLPAQVERAIRDANASIRGPLPIIPSMSTGATDGLYLRNAGIPVYGVGGRFVDPAIAADTRAHGLDERIGVQAYYDQLEFTYRLLKAL
jgi:acetylornithine deacetylase/succinyl-diaminopimelate desuccinylase-like protein